MDRSESLGGRVALVTGASRGAGRGIAAALGEHGATVYVTGRSTRSGGATEELPGTIEETAEEVTARGGRGIPVRCDHTVDDDVSRLLRRVRKESGRLDVLVNNVWGGYESYDHASFDAPFQDQPLGLRWRGMFEAGLRAHLATSHLALPLLLETPARLVVSTVAWAYGAHLGNLFYDVAKAAIVRMAEGLAVELRPRGIASVALAPGFMRTERVMRSWNRKSFDLDGTESPEYVGRAVAALAMDPERMERSGRVLTAGDLAREYGFTDTDGSRPEAFRIADRDAGSRLHHGLYEAHLPVTDVGRSMDFYVDKLGFEPGFGSRDDASVLLLYREGRTRWMLGLFRVGEIEHRHPAEYHLSFRVAAADADRMVRMLAERGIEAVHPPTAPLQGPMEEPIVHGWMPAAAVFFRDPDGHLLELTADLDGPPRPDFQYRPLGEWRDLAPADP